MSNNTVRLFPPAFEDNDRSTSELSEELASILSTNALSALFQPIVDFQSQSIMGYESLIRGPSDSALHNPVMLFDIARREGALPELDLLCKRTGINEFKAKRLAGKLFLNTTPQGLFEPDHRTGLTLEYLLKIGLRPEHVVIELTEQYPMTDFSMVSHALEHYRRMGFEIAIDDLGAGYSGLTRWAELRPEYVKIDRHFIENIHSDSVKQSFVRSIVDIAKELQCKVIAEGIERREECQTLIDMGVPLGQGYYFGRPQSNPVHILSESLFLAADGASFRNQPWQCREDILNLLTPAPFLQRHDSLEQAYSLFVEDEDLSAIAIVDQLMAPIGLIRRSNLFNTFSSHYGRSLHGSKPVLNFMDNQMVVVDRSASIDQASNLITDKMKSQIEADFIIADQGKYVGTGKVLGLLKKITDLQIRNARYANPLTLLPGNVPIYERLDELIADQVNFTVAYCDLDNFKPYNDVYGYFEGDRVIKLIADILRDNIHKTEDFIGHVGGDDFIAIFLCDDWQASCQNILDRFASSISAHYTDSDRKQGGIYAQSREGVEHFYPIMTLSIGIVTPDINRFISHNDVSNLASHAKHNAKQIKGNSLFVERNLA